jgi:hypothetical protein
MARPWQVRNTRNNRQTLCRMRAFKRVQSDNELCMSLVPPSLRWLKGVACVAVKSVAGKLANKYHIEYDERLVQDHLKQIRGALSGKGAEYLVGDCLSFAGVHTHCCKALLMFERIWMCMSFKPPLTGFQPEGFRPGALILNTSGIARVSMFAPFTRCYVQSVPKHVMEGQQMCSNKEHLFQLRRSFSRFLCLIT